MWPEPWVCLSLPWETGSLRKQGNHTCCHALERIPRCSVLLLRHCSDTRRFLGCLWSGCPLHDAGWFPCQVLWNASVLFTCIFKTLALLPSNEVCEVTLKLISYIFVRLCHMSEAIVNALLSALSERDWTSSSLRPLLKSKLNAAQVAIAQVFHGILFQNSIQPLLDDSKSVKDSLWRLPFNILFVRGTFYKPVMNLFCLSGFTCADLLRKKLTWLTCLSTQCHQSWLREGELYFSIDSLKNLLAMISMSFHLLFCDRLMYVHEVLFPFIENRDLLIQCCPTLYPFETEMCPIIKS